MAGLCTSALCCFHEDLKHVCEQKRDGGSERDRHVGQASVAGLPQPGVAQAGRSAAGVGAVADVVEGAEDEDAEEGVVVESMGSIAAVVTSAIVLTSNLTATPRSERAHYDRALISGGCEV